MFADLTPHLPGLLLTHWQWAAGLLALLLLGACVSRVVRRRLIGAGVTLVIGAIALGVLHNYRVEVADTGVLPLLQQGMANSPLGNELLGTSQGQALLRMPATAAPQGGSKRRLDALAEVDRYREPMVKPASTAP